MPAPGVSESVGLGGSENLYFNTGPGEALAAGGQTAFENRCSGGVNFSRQAGPVAFRGGICGPHSQSSPCLSVSLDVDSQGSGLLRHPDVSENRAVSLVGADPGEALPGGWRGRG